MKEKPERIQAFLFISAIILLTIICYSNSFTVPFHYDDRKVILADYRLRDLGNLKDIVFSNPTRGLSNLSFALNYHFNGFNPSGFHAVNLFFHIINGILIFLISSEFIFKSRLLSFLSSLFFTLHPVNVESVTYISSRAGVMSTTFFLVSFFIFNKFVKDEKIFIWKRALSYLLVLLSYLFSVMSKEIGITLPVVLVLYDLCSTAPDSQSVKDIFQKCKQKIKLIYYFPFFAIVALMFILRRFAVGSFLNPTFTRNYHVNLLTQINATLANIKLLFLPVNLNIDHDFPLTTGITLKTIFSSVIIILIFYYVVKKITVLNKISFSVIWFFITLAPTSLIPLEDVLSERWLYLPCVGFSIFLAILTGSFAEKKAVTDINKKKLRYEFIICLILVFLLSAYSRNLIWQDGLTLWQDAVRKSPEKERPHNNLGAEYMARGKMKQGFEELKKAVKINPFYKDAFVNLGVLYGMDGKFDEAFFYINKSLSLDPKNHVAFNNLGNIYKAKGETALAIENYKKAIEIEPNYSDPYYNLGILYRNLGMLTEAEQGLKKSIILDPELPSRRIEMGLLYIETNRFQLAFNEFQSALKLDSKNIEAMNNLGIVFGISGKYREAEQQFKNALRIMPAHINASINLSQIYIKTNELDNALGVLRNAMKFYPDFYELYFKIGMIYKMKGLKQEAIKNFQESLRINPQNKEAEIELKELIN